MKPTQVLATVFNVLVTAAAVKAALTTLSRPMGGSPATKAIYQNRRLGPVTVEGYDEDDDLEGLDYEDLL